MQRREFLTSSATAVTVAWTDWGPLGWGPLASADEDEQVDYDGPAPDLDEFPDHLTNIRFDEEELENYQPLLAVTPDGRSEMRGMYGWSCDTEDYEQTAHYYWVRYNTQNPSPSIIGIDWGPDDHHLDHEPVIVFQNPDGTVHSVVASGGHHYAMEVDGEFGNLSEDRVPGLRTHVNLICARPHNHYLEAPDGRHTAFVQSYASFGNWLQVYETWFRNGRFDDTADEAVLDPYSFLDTGEKEYRTHWWQSNTWDAWASRYIRIRRLSDRDQLRYEE